jgi:hypothetical protein
MGLLMGHHMGLLMDWGRGLWGLTVGSNRHGRCCSADK